MFHVLAQDGLEPHHQSSGKKKRAKKKGKQHAAEDTTVVEHANAGLSDEEALKLALQESAARVHGVGRASDVDVQGSEDHKLGTGKKPQRFVGLLNQGATCYLNSLLQSLFMLPEVRWGLYSLNPSDLFVPQSEVAPSSLENSDQSHDSVQKKPRWIILRLQQLFAALQHGARSTGVKPPKALSTQPVTDSFGWKDNDQVYQQHDVSELNRILIDAIQQSLQDTKGRSLVADIFSGETAVSLTCDDCGFCSERVERVYDLTLPVQGATSLEKSLSAYFTNERLEGHNQWRCGGCGQKVNATRVVKMRSLPPVLTLCLLRFSYDWKSNQRVKINDHQSFPFLLDMSPFTEQQKSGDAGLSSHGASMDLAVHQVFPYSSEPHYELASVVIHRGGAHEGHYHAFIRDLVGECEWTSSNAHRTELQELETENASAGLSAVFPGLSGIAQHNSNSKQQRSGGRGRGNDHPLVSVFISILRQHGSIRMDQLGDVFYKERGESWNKTYRGKLGTLSRFLNRFPHAFVVTDGQVALAPQQKTSKSSKQTKDQSAENQSAGGVEAKGVESPKSPPKPPKETHPGWFHFNDDEVSPMFSKRVESVFGGQKDCAYMLMYRRKLVQTVEESKSHAAPIPPLVPPPHVLEMLQEDEQKQLKRQQLELERQSQVALCFTQLSHVHTDWPISEHHHVEHKEVTTAAVVAADVSAAAAVAPPPPPPHANWHTVTGRMPFFKTVDSRMTLGELETLMRPLLFLPDHFPAAGSSAGIGGQGHIVDEHERKHTKLNSHADAAVHRAKPQQQRQRQRQQRLIFFNEEGVPLSDLAQTLKDYHIHDGCQLFVEAVEHETNISSDDSDKHMQQILQQYASHAIPSLTSKEMSLRRANKLIRIQVAVNRGDGLGRRVTDNDDRLILSYYMPEFWAHTLTLGWLRDAVVRAVPSLIGQSEAETEAEQDDTHAVEAEHSSGDTAVSDDDDDDVEVTAGSMGRLLQTTGELLVSLDAPLSTAVVPGGVLLFEPVPMPASDEVYLKVQCVKRGKPTGDEEAHLTLSVDQTIGEAKALCAASLHQDHEQVILRRCVRNRRGHLTAGDFLLYEEEALSSLEPQLCHGDVLFVELEEKPIGSAAAANAMAEKNLQPQLRVRLHLISALDDPHAHPNFRTPSEPADDSPAMPDDPYSLPRSCVQPLLSRSCDASKTTIFDIKTALLKAAAALDVQPQDRDAVGSSSSHCSHSSVGFQVDGVQILADTTPATRSVLSAAFKGVKNHSYLRLYRLEAATLQPRAVFKSLNTDLRSQRIQSDDVDIGVQVLPANEQLGPRSKVFFVFSRLLDASSVAGTHRRTATHVHQAQEAQNFSQFLNKLAATVNIPQSRLRVALYERDLHAWRELSLGSAKQRKRDKGGKRLLASLVKAGDCAFLSVIDSNTLASLKEAGCEVPKDIWNTPYDVWLREHVRSTTSSRSPALTFSRQLSAAGALTIDVDL